VVVGHGKTISLFQPNGNENAQGESESWGLQFNSGSWHPQQSTDGDEDYHILLADEPMAAPAAFIFDVNLYTAGWSNFFLSKDCSP
jgi:hypothetical protein